MVRALRLRGPATGTRRNAAGVGSGSPPAPRSLGQRISFPVLSFVTSVPARAHRWPAAPATARSRWPTVGAMAKPVLVAVDGEEASRQAVAHELETRYGAHYRIISSPSSKAALAALERLRDERADVP